MMRPANALRGEAVIVIDDQTYMLRPTFAALVAAEHEIGPLFALVERAGKGELRLTEMAALFWHCLEDSQDVTREEVGAAVLGLGLADATKPLRILLGQVLQGR